jgi:hypothetical protein
LKPKKVIIAKTVPSGGTKNPHLTAEKLVAEVCYHYPVYTLSQARRLPARDVLLLLKVAKQKRAENYYELTHIAAAPHTRKGQGVKALLDRYKEMKNG